MSTRDFHFHVPKLVQANLLPAVDGGDLKGLVVVPTARPVEGKETTGLKSETEVGASSIGGGAWELLY